jgi:hypothetical protein
MKSKTKFSFWFLISNLLVWLLLFAFQQVEIIKLTGDKMNLILLGDLIAVSISFALIFPMLKDEIQSFVLQYLILITFQLLFMLGFVIYEIVQWKKDLNLPVFIQLVPFLSLIVFQSIFLYQFRKNK